MSEYLAKFIARCGAAARRKAAELVKSGSVRVNGRVITDPAFSVDITADRVELNGKILQVPTENIYIMLNKPVGYTTSHFDKHAEHLAIELINCPEAQRLIPAGRLDRESEGLLIFSNDGDFIQKLAHPRYDIRKRYRVTASIFLDRARQQKMLNGIADGVLLEEGGAVVIDYKTDRVKTEDVLLQRYRGQLELYAMLLSETLGCPVRECWIYSFALGRAVQVC